jgi:hypothetical protein
MRAASLNLGHSPSIPHFWVTKLTSSLLIGSTPITVPFPFREWEEVIISSGQRKFMQRSLMASCSFVLEEAIWALMSSCTIMELKSSTKC